MPLVFGMATLGSVGFYQQHNPCPTGQSFCSYRLSRFTTALLHSGLTPTFTGAHPAGGVYWLIAIPAAFALVVVFFVVRGGGRPLGRIVSAVGAGPVLLAALVMVGFGEPGAGSLLPSGFTARGLVGVVVLSVTMLVIAAVERNKALALLAAGAVGVALLANLYDIENVTGYIGNSATVPNVIVPGAYFLLAALVLGLPDVLAWARRSWRGGEAPQPVS